MSDNQVLLVAIGGLILFVLCLQVLGGVIPWVVARQVQKLMRESSPERDVRGAVQTGPEQTQSSPLEFQLQDVAAASLSDKAVREQYSSRWEALTNEACVFDVFAGLGFALATVFSAVIAGTLSGLGIVDEVMGFAEPGFWKAFLDVLVLSIFGIGFSIFALLRRWLHSPRFTTQDGQLGSPGDDLPGLFLPMIQIGLAAANPGTAGQGAIRAIRLLTAPRHRAWQTFVFIAFAVVLGGSLTMEMGIGLPILIAAFAHLAFFIGFDRELQKERGLRLLVLRVFDMAQNNDFTFRRALKVWGFFGSYFTVVDSSLARFENRLFSLRNFFRGLGFLIACGFFVWAVGSLAGMFGVTAANAGWIDVSALAVFLLVAAFAYYRMCYGALAGSFIRSDVQLGKLSHKLHERPRRLGLGFKNVSVFAHSNTWNMTVSEFLSLADVVLMDLRGWNENRKSSAWEVNHLLDVMELRRVVFLCDESNANAVGKMIRESWAALSERSPNLAPGSRTVSLLVSLKQPDESDVQGLIERLIAAADPPRASWLDEQFAKA